MRKVPFLAIGKILLLLFLVPLSSNAIAPLALIATGKAALLTAIGVYNAVEKIHKNRVATDDEKLTSVERTKFQKLDSIEWNLADLKNSMKNWQVKEENKYIIKKIDKLMKKIIKINQKYEAYKRFKFNNSFLVNGVLVKAESENIEHFAESAISFNNGELPEIVKGMHTAFTGLGILTDSILSVLSRNKKAYLMCIKQQSAQQLILELFRSVTDADMKGLIIMLFAFDELSKRKGNETTHNFEFSKIIEQEQFKARVDNTRNEVKSQMAYASREVWRCDPQIHVKDFTFTKIQEVFQTYAFHEKDYSNNLCQQQCSEYSYKPFTPTCKTDFCKKHTERKRCYGKLKNCQKIHKKQKYCFAPESSDRRYEWMLTGSNTTYGSYDEDCENTVDVDQTPGITYITSMFGAFPIKSDCDTCLCTCVSDKKAIDRYFSLKPVYADVDKNMVVTGIRFVKNGNILSLQIQQGKLTPNGTVNQNSLEWKNETESADSVYNVSEERNTVFLDDILSPSEYYKKYLKKIKRYGLPENFIVSGVKLAEVDKCLRLQVSFVPYDFKSGTIYDYTASSLKFYGNDKHKDKRPKLLLDESADPTKTYENFLDSINQQRVEFQLSGLKRDFGQSTIPYIDIQEVVTYPAVPLVGLGLMHKGTKGYGGFLGLKLIQFDYTAYI